MGSQELRLVGGEIADGGRDDRAGRETSHKSCGELGWRWDIAAVSYSYLVRGMCALTGGQSVSDLRWIALMRPKRVV